MTVSQFLEIQFGYEYNMRWWCVLIMLAFILFFRITSILALKYCECAESLYCLLCY